MPARTITITEAARFLGVSQQTVRRLIQNGVLTVREDRTVPLSDLTAYAESRQQVLPRTYFGSSAVAAMRQVLAEQSALVTPTPQEPPAKGKEKPNDLPLLAKWLFPILAILIAATGILLRVFGII